jgi:hypothetical protein
MLNSCVQLSLTWACPPQGLAHMAEPDPKWRNEADCGMATFNRSDGTTISLNCAGGLQWLLQLLASSATSFIAKTPHCLILAAGPRHVYYRDLDGTLTGSAGATILGAYLTPRADSLIDQVRGCSRACRAALVSHVRSGLCDLDPSRRPQGAPTATGPCTYNDTISGYVCLPGATSASGLPSGWPASQPLPPKGIFGDPQLFVLESRDPDSETRNFSPVTVDVNGVQVGGAGHLLRSIVRVATGRGG